MVKGNPQIYFRKYAREILFTLLAFLSIFIVYYHKSDDLSLDLGDQLTTGRIILFTHHVPLINLFSYTYPQFPFVNTQWLSEIIFYLIFSYFGIDGLIIFTTMIMVLSFLTIYFYVLNRININLLALLTFIYIFILTFRINIRPEIFSYLILSCMVFILFKFREKYTPLVYLLIPLELLWVNLHIYFIIGIFIIGCFFTDAIYTFIKYRKNIHIKTLGGVLFASIAVCFCNPNYITGAVYPFIFEQNYAVNVSENQSLFALLSDKQEALPISIIFFAIAAITFLMCSLFLGKKSRFIDWLITLPLIVLPLLEVRNISLFVFGTFISYTYVFSTFFNSYKFVFPIIITKNKKLITVFFSILLGCLFIWQADFIYQHEDFGLGSSDLNVNVLNFFKSKHLKGPIFNDYNIGDSLIFGLYPQEKVFVDEKPDAYPSSFFTQIYNPMLQNQEVFKAMDKKYKFNVIMFAISDGPQVPFLNRILKDPNWKLIYLDQYAIIFVKNDKQNKSLLRYTISENNYTIPTNLSDNLIDYFGLFLNAIGWQEKALEVFEEEYQRDPSDCNSLHNVVYLFGQIHQDIPAIYYQNLNTCQL